MTIEEFHKMVVDRLVADAPQYEQKLRQLGIGDDLLGSGAVDSHRFVDMCLFVEEKTGVPIDIAEIDPDLLSSIGGIYEIVSRG